MLAPSTPPLFPRRFLLRLLLSCGLVGMVFVLYLNQATIVVLGISLFLAYLLDPVIDRLEAIGLSRSLAIVLMTVVGLLGVLGLVLLMKRPLQTQINQMVELAPRLAREMYTFLVELARSWSLPFEQERLESYVGRLQTWAEANFTSVIERVWRVVQQMFTGLTAFVVSMVHITLVPVLTFYLLRDYDILHQRLYAALPPLWRPTIADWLGELEHVLGGFLRGQFTIALILAGLYALGLSLLGVPMGMLLGIISGLANMVPYMSLIVGLIPALLLCALRETPELWHILGVLLVYSGGQCLEGMYLSPRIIGQETGLHPVVVMVAIMIGGTLFGLTGLVLAVPVAALLKVVLSRWHRAWKATWSSAVEEIRDT